LADEELTWPAPQIAKKVRSYNVGQKKKELKDLRVRKKRKRGVLASLLGKIEGG